MVTAKIRKAGNKESRHSAALLQYGALAYRKTKANGTEFLLITTRETKRWVIPKGWPIKGLEP